MNTNNNKLITSQNTMQKLIILKDNPHSNFGIHYLQYKQINGDYNVKNECESSFST